MNAKAQESAKLGIEPAERIAELCEIIEEANRNYYELDEPTLSDAAYDKLFRE